jgi:hypothetical protein
MRVILCQPILPELHVMRDPFVALVVPSPSSAMSKNRATTAPLLKSPLCRRYLHYLSMSFKNIIDITGVVATILRLFFTSDETRIQQSASRGLLETVGVAASI